eukprot:11495686-Prorocentrum_lima.AAC.1
MQERAHRLPKNAGRPLATPGPNSRHVTGNLGVHNGHPLSASRGQAAKVQQQTLPCDSPRRAVQEPTK